MGFQHQIDSCYKMLVYFVDGNKGTYYSLDWVSQRSTTKDPDLGLKRLRALVDEQGALAATTIIYDNVTKQRLEQYSKGIRTF